MKIPSYPDFRPIELADKGLFDELFLNAHPEICEFTFANLYVWRSLYNLEVSTFADFIILSSHKNDKRSFFDPVGSNDKKSAMQEIMEKTGESFILVPESTKRLFEREPGYSLELDRDNADYLYRASDLISLKGKKYDGKRNYIRRFKASNTYTYRSIQEKDKKDCLDFVEKWCKFKDCEENESLGHEKDAIQDMLENFSYLKLSGGAIDIAGEIQAIALGEALNDTTYVMHVLKARSGIVGLNQTMDNEFLTKEASGFEFVNMEQDLGVEGLRKSKLSYYPTRLVNKYTLQRK